MTDLRCWLALHRAPGIGPQSFAQLLHHVGDPQTILATPLKALMAYGLHPATLNYMADPAWREVDKDLQWLAQSPHHHIITYHDARYPPLLKELPGAPPLLYVQGDIALLNTPQIAMVGSRNPSALGAENAFHFAQQLAAIGYSITSGLALGIDAASHRGALAAAGSTLAVAATGLDRIYPAQHVELVQEIITHGGAILSEFPIGTPPKKEHFPRRNRIISGLALGTLVVEAALRSGSLITARLSADQGREVFAIPGSIHNPLAKGCHYLIKEGAKLVESADDLIEELTGTLFSRPRLRVEKEEIAPITSDLIGDSALVFNKIGHDPSTIDHLIERTGLTAEMVSSILMELELRGYITSTPGGHYTRQALRGAQ